MNTPNQSDREALARIMGWRHVDDIVLYAAYSCSGWINASDGRRQKEMPDYFDDSRLFKELLIKAIAIDGYLELYPKSVCLFPDSGEREYFVEENLQHAVAWAVKEAG